MGKVTAKFLIQSGYTVYGAARRTEKMNDLRQSGAKILQMDVTNDQSMESGVEEVIKNEGRIDILINNAGFGSFEAIEDVTMIEAKYQIAKIVTLLRLRQALVTGFK